MLCSVGLRAVGEKCPEAGGGIYGIFVAVILRDCEEDVGRFCEALNHGVAAMLVSG